jgi:hypothetical protein
MAEKLSHYTRTAVETSAEAAARENRTPLEACPYRQDFAPLEFEHWRAVFVLAGGILNPKEAP